jgi:DNA-binding transcriptional regulator GbsR (MarR family)
MPKGYAERAGSIANDELPELDSWEQEAVNAVGHVIEFWGFKRNYGRIWALLYLRDHPMASADLQSALNLSKGSVSMLTRDLEDYSVIQRTRVSDSRAWHFEAETQFMNMVRQVLQRREMSMVREVRTSLEHAKRLAEDDDASDATLARLERMATLAGTVESALDFFVSTAKMDVTDADDILNS